MSTRTVTYDLTLITGSAAASKVVTFDLLTPFAARSADTVVQITFSSTSDENGAGTVTLAVPSSGAYLYSCTLPDGQSFRFSLEAGSATTLHALMAATVGSTVTSADAITAAIDSHNTDTTDVHGITDTSALVTTSDYTAADVLTKLLTVDGTGTGLDADTVDGSHASAFEAALGNPDSDGYVLSSTAAGVRSWVQSAADVGDLTTTTGSSTDMLRVAAAGGLEYRTAAQVLSDIGAAPTASPTFTGTVTLPTTVASVIKPAADSTTALQLANAAGTAIVTVSTSGAGALNLTQFAGIEWGSGYSIYAASNGMYFLIKSWDRPVIISTKLGAIFTANDETGNIALGQGDINPTARADVGASTTAAASLRIRSGTAPTSPNDGDIWYDGSNLKIRIGATTYNVDVTAV